jgi:hypothetical protein
MKLKYTLTMEDIYALNDYLIANSPVMKRSIRRGQLLMALCPLAGVLCLIYIKGLLFTNVMLPLLAFGIILGLPLYFLYPKYIRHYQRKTVQGLYAEGQNKGILGQHEIMIDEDGIVENTEYNVTKQRWESIEKIVTGTKHTHIFISPLLAYTIPADKVLEGEYGSFVAELTKAYNKNKV